MHTNDAFGAVPRLVDMGIEPFLIASSLNLVVAQRLIRRVCPHCRQVIELPVETEKQIEQDLKQSSDIKLDVFRSKTGRLKFYRGVGCSRCNNEGYQGRIAIFEALEITDEMKNIITIGSKIEEVKQEFRRQKMIEMIEDGYIKALQGITTLEEVLRAARE